MLNHRFEQFHPPVGEQLAEPRAVFEVDDVWSLLTFFLLFGALDGRRLRLLRWERRDRYTTVAGISPI